ncbi:MAG: serine/threonine protein kinase [Polyangiales bacterium]|jgi:serine/threonine protein kinase
MEENMAMTHTSGGQSPQSKGRAIPFGKYLLLDRLAVGGMAEVFLAKSFGIEGFEKIIAVKRILPTMAEDEDFINMFIDEAKIAGHLNHANIAPIYELGKIGESHYIAMEYVWGKDLLQIMNRFRKMRKRMSAEMVAFIGTRMCEALEYAHGKRDRDGQPLNLIHRDISPQNVLVSYEGAVKLIDFGIAKAASRTTTTQAGVLKGKFGYMSPEQVRGLPIDHRSDLFAVGTCLYEMLTADRLFVGESDFSTLEKVRHAAARPPSEFIPDLSPEFERIVMRALARNVDDRWQSAGDLHEALQQFLVAQRPTFTTTKLAAWMTSAFAEEVAKEKGRLDGYAKVARPSNPPANETGPKLTNPPPPPKPAEPDPYAELEGESTMITASPFDAMEALAAAGPPPPAEIEEEATQIFFSSEEFEEVLESAAAPVPAPRVFAPPKPLGVPPLAPSPGIGRGAGLSNVAPESQATLMGIEHPDLGSPPPPFAPPPFAPPPFAPPPGPLGHQPPPGFTAPPMASATAELPRPPLPGEKEPRKTWLIFALAGVIALAVIAAAVFALTGADVGTIEIRTTPPIAAEVRIDGVARGTAPVRIEGVPAGARVVTIVAPGYAEWQENVTVAEGGISTLSVALTAAVAVEPPEPPPEPPEPEVVAVADTVVDPETLPEAELPELEDPPEVEDEPEVEARMVTAMRATMRVAPREDNEPTIMRIARTDSPPSMMSSGGRGTLVINTIPWAEVYIDGRATGLNTPVRGHRVSAGSHRIGLKTQDGEMHNVTVEVPAGETVRIMRRLN